MHATLWLKYRTKVLDHLQAKGFKRELGRIEIEEMKRAIAINVPSGEFALFVVGLREITGRLEGTW